MVDQLRRVCSYCTAFNGTNLQGEPTCWNLTSIDGQEPTAKDLCDQHTDAMEAAMLDELLDRLPFDDCGEAVEAEAIDRIKAVDDFNRRMLEARRTTAQTLARAAHG